MYSREAYIYRSMIFDIQFGCGSKPISKRSLICDRTYGPARSLFLESSSMSSALLLYLGLHLHGCRTLIKDVNMAHLLSVVSKPLIFAMLSSLAVLLFALVALTSASPSRKRGADCTSTVDSLDDAANVKECTTVVINGFTVPAGETLTLDFADGSTVSVSEYIASFSLCWTVSRDDIRW